MNRLVPQETALQVLQKLLAEGYDLRYQPDKHRTTVLDPAGNELLHFRLPLLLPPPSMLGQVTRWDMHYIILLIQSGSCAVGYFENGQNLDHKVFRSYMVRKKQGKSQVKYLKTKGKSRAGSRVRLGETQEFFENINERLQEYFEEHEIHRIAMSCSKILIPYLFDSKVATPFNKKDERLLKIPKHIHTPIYEVLLNTHKFLLKGELIYDVSQQPLIDSLLPPPETAASDTDWEFEEEEAEYENDEEFEDEEE
ncbi:hypothetical protein FVR03_01635 [Pontibacter qinzhouensis]|uniref:VLRF1 domain-containing protein n=1 Tax=Pontibacter qinzhouensis TaxID=2603253 RepID=A0A5C8KCD3_9BACT|nr:hypothetical protein [Pontibacter qinzhouensis]TXK52149.1 hypothetical protein FVR03_01635 [Pontibacter qinzhouensis]